MIDAIEQHRPELEALCQRYRVQRLFLVGSAVDGTFDPARSDLDFLVEFHPDDKSATTYFGMLEDLKALFGREVDLIERGAVTNPYLRHALESEKVALYGAA